MQQASIERIEPGAIDADQDAADGQTDTSQRREPVQLEVRVLEGELRGARTVVDAAYTVKAGQTLQSDVVLRSEELGGRTLSFRAHGHGVLVHVRGGDALVGQHRFEDGQKFLFPLYRPLKLGEMVIAFGQPGNASWLQLASAQDEGLAHEGDDPLAAAQYVGFDAQAAHAVAMGQSQDRPVAHRWSKWLAMAGSAVAAVSMGAWALAYAVAPNGPTPEQQLQAAQSDLRHAGLSGLNVALQDGGGALLVSGYLDKTAQRAQAEQLMARRTLPAQYKVWVNEDLVVAVRDVFRVQGVQAEIKALGPGAMLAETHLADLARIDTVKTVARRDVPGLTAIEVHNVAPPPVPEPVPVIDDPGKRVASIVPGNPAYVVTADGTRYFQGALLPTGHRIVAVKTGEVLLERGGQSMALQF